MNCIYLLIDFNCLPEEKSNAQAYTNKEEKIRRNLTITSVAGRPKGNY